VASAAILVGGRATRYGGRDKSALPVGGRTVLERQVAELTRVADDIMLVGGANRTAAARTLTSSSGVTVRWVPDRTSGLGPLGGLDAALDAARDREVVLLACDMPFVTSGLMEYLITLVEDFDAVVPRTARGDHPLCGVYIRDCRAAVTRTLSEGRLAMRDLLVQLRIRSVSEEELRPFGDPGRLLANVNTPAEYEELEALQGHHR
jgi:molybdopterin-guanine dinucleotide biosynthesis protein A